MTDGKQNDWYGGEAGVGDAEALSTTARIKAEGARLVMVGYGDDIDYDQMDTMASEPSTTCAGLICTLTLTLTLALALTLVLT